MAAKCDLKLKAIGVNRLVKLSAMLERLESETKFKFRDLNRRYKATLMARFLRTLKDSCEIKGSFMRPKGHELIRKNLSIATGGHGRGVSAFQVLVGGEASKFARIYDQGGVISPKASRYLAVPTVQLQRLSMNFKGRSPSEVLTLLNSQGIQTTTIPLNRHSISNEYQLGGEGGESFAGKLIIGKFKRYKLAQRGKNLLAQSVKQVGLYILIHHVEVKPSNWLRDGTERFVTEEAIPLLTLAAKEAEEKLLKDITNA